jgi:hypothetical protein
LYKWSLYCGAGDRDSWPAAIVVDAASVNGASCARCASSSRGVPRLPTAFGRSEQVPPRVALAVRSSIFDPSIWSRAIQSKCSPISSCAVARSPATIATRHLDRTSRWPGVDSARRWTTSSQFSGSIAHPRSPRPPRNALTIAMFATGSRRSGSDRRPQIARGGRNPIGRRPRQRWWPCPVRRRAAVSVRVRAGDHGRTPTASC